LGQFFVGVQARDAMGLVYFGTLDVPGIGFDGGEATRGGAAKALLDLGRLEQLGNGDGLVSHWRSLRA
jgi:hypothetical protein